MNSEKLLTQIDDAHRDAERLAVALNTVGIATEDLSDTMEGLKEKVKHIMDFCDKEKEGADSRALKAYTDLLTITDDKGYDLLTDYRLGQIARMKAFKEVQEQLIIQFGHDFS